MPTRRNAEAGRLEAWIVENSTVVALAIFAVAFVIRLYYANASYINPDEALHFDTARPATWVEAFKSSLRLSHPPLFILVLHGFMVFGRSELILRLPSLLGGTAALWFTFEWLRRSFGAIPGLAGLTFMALSPEAISAATEIRQYGVLLFFVCGALYATERIFATRSSRWVVIQGLFLLGALLTHYVVVLILVSLGVYVLLRLVLDRFPIRVLITFCVSQLILASTLACLYFGHVRRSIPFGSGASMDYLRHYYYNAALESRFGFVCRSIYKTFSYMAGSRALAIVLVLILFAALALIIAGKTNAPRITALLLVSPFVAGFAAAAFQVFPFAGTRHQTYLLPFVAAAIAAAVACLPERWQVSLLLLGAVIAPVWIKRAPPDNDPRTMPKRDMTAAVQYIRRMVPRGQPLFVDTDTREIFEYYMGANDKTLDKLRPEADLEEPLAGYRAIVAVVSVTASIVNDPRLASTDFAIRPRESIEQVLKSAKSLGLPPADPLWVASVAWKEPPLSAWLSNGPERDVKGFGEITVVKLFPQAQPTEQMPAPH